MNTRTSLLAAAVAMALLSSSVYADRGESRHGRDQQHHNERHSHRGHRVERSYPQIIYVPVMYVVPVYETIRTYAPHRECWRSSTTTTRHGPGSATGTILGGVIGGVVGHDLARGHHEDLAILAGTLLGATVGHDLTHSTHSAVPVTQTHCEYRDDGYDEVSRVVGYDVTYRYYDRTYVKRTHRHPGSRIQINVNIDG